MRKASRGTCANECHKNFCLKEMNALGEVRQWYKSSCAEEEHRLGYMLCLNGRDKSWDVSVYRLSKGWVVMCVRESSFTLFGMEEHARTPDMCHIYREMQARNTPHKS